MAKISELYSLPTSSELIGRGHETDLFSVMDKNGFTLAICTDGRTAEDISLALNRHDELFEKVTASS